MASARGSLDLSDLQSTLRHFIFPIIAGGVLAGLQVAQTGNFDLTAIKTASITAAIACGVRLLQKWLKDNT